MAATNVIEKFGGQSALARLLGKGPSTVRYWAHAGTIPAKWHPVLLRLAEERGVDLQPSDLLAEDPTAPDEVFDLPRALYDGVLVVSDDERLPCYVLDDGRRIISRTGATNYLTQTNHGNLESYTRIGALREYLPAGFEDSMIEFRIPEVANKTVRGVTAETFLDLCTAYVRARDEGALTTPKQQQIAAQASMFLAACAKIGLIALIDEATGYQYARAQDALQFKLRVFLEDEMRKWEKTFPDELWVQLGRLTNWKGSVTNRPKYWGRLVMELVYDYLDPDVAKWLRENAPQPKKGQNYHQWLSSQYGLKKLTEHLWRLIGIASTCHSLHELKTKLAEIYGRQPVQYTLWLDPPRATLPPPYPGRVSLPGRS